MPTEKETARLRTKVILVLGAVLSVYGAKSGDEEKPYEFGFTIDGQQHRHEKKDANGIIQGEFGFITADGVYHVTVYATDENGSFKILSMKNIKISPPLDGSGDRSIPSIKPPVSGQTLNAQPSPKPSAQLQNAPSPIVTVRPPPPSPIALTTTLKGPYKFTTQPTIKPGCAGCGYVTTSPRPPGSPAKLNFQNPSFQQTGPLQTNSGQQINPQQQTNFGNPQPISAISQPPIPNPSQPISEITNERPQPPAALPSPITTVNRNSDDIAIPVNTLQPPGTPEYNRAPPSDAGKGAPFVASPSPSQPNFGNNDITRPQDFGGTVPQNPIVPFPPQTQPADSQDQNPFPPQTQLGNYQDPSQGQNPNPPTNYPSSPPQTQLANYQDQSQGENPNPPANYPSSPAHNRADDIVVTNGVINVPNNPPIKIADKYPGMSEGLPNGINEGDITDLLYKFNYTVGFHGHYEKGWRNGTKIGGYFVNGRDGISRVVTYVADEFGYRPKFKLVNLGLDSSDTPKADTEKTFGLKSFEFVWYPLK